MAEKGTNYLANDGKQSAVDYRENCDEAHVGEQELSKKLQTVFDKENMGEYRDLLQGNVITQLSWEAPEDKIVDQPLDPLVESIHILQSAQEALKKEIDELREIGKERTAVFDDLEASSSLCAELTSVHTMDSGNIRQNSSDCLKEDEDVLEKKLEEARATLKVTESKVTELEITLASSSNSGEEEMARTYYSEMEAELEDLFKQKIEAEVEYLVMSRTCQIFNGATEKQIELFEDQRALAMEQSRMLNKLVDAESKASILETQAETLGTYCGDIVETNKVLDLENGVFKTILCLLIQLILLAVVFVWFVVQLSPYYEEEIVPT